MLSYAYLPRSQQHLRNKCTQQKQVTQMHYCWAQTAAKKECGHSGQHTSSKKWSATLTVVGLNNKRAVYIASSKFSEPKRFVRRLNKFGGKYIQEQQLNQFHCHNLNRVFFSKDGPESFQVIDWYPNEKMVVVPVCLYVPCFDVGCCSSECVGVVSH